MVSLTLDDNNLLALLILDMELRHKRRLSSPKETDSAKQLVAEKKKNVSILIEFL